MIVSLVALQVMFGVLVGSAAFSPETADVDAAPAVATQGAGPTIALEPQTFAVEPSASPDTRSAGTPGDDLGEVDGETVGESFPAMEWLIDPVEPPVARISIHAEPEVLTLALGPTPVQVFPVVGGGAFSSSFGAPRPEGRTHKGNDIFAAKMTPVVAVAPGQVIWASREPGEQCCYVKIRHDDGSETFYLHLNNDTEGTDDGLGWGLADGVVKGTRVEVGDVIGYVGDSGNAEGTPSHLHFEYSPPGSDAVDPNTLLRQAPIVAEGGTGAPVYAAVETLPFTGITSEGLALAALVLMLGGLATLRLSRRFTGSG